ncbi:MAG: dynamin family protein [Muribaculaceae bacterium]
MEIDKILNNYADVANELGIQSAENLIKDFSLKSLNNRYELPLIGQFSAGKSATINHLLGKSFLPTKSIETTAFPTFISYSEHEYATLEMSDGSLRNFSFDEVKLLDNQKINETGEQIKSLTIGLNSDLLKSGLTFVDTPGVNTIITTHIEITERILEHAQCIIYVVAKNLTDEDVMMIQTIESHNIPVIFVRTHIDDIKSAEEDWRKTIQENEQNLAKQLGHPVKFFAISNDESRSEFEDNFNRFKTYISKDIAQQVKSVFDNAILQRLEPIRTELEAAISIRKRNIEQTVGKSVEEIEKQKSKIESIIEGWKEKLSLQQKLAAKKEEEVKKEIKDSIRKSADSQIYEFENIVNDLASVDPESIAADLKQNIEKASSLMNKKAEALIQSEANSLSRKLGAEIQSVKTELDSIGLNSDCTFDLSVVNDYAERQKSMDEEFAKKIAQINEIKENISKQEQISEAARQELEGAIAQAESEINECKSRVNEINNSYEPHYIAKPSKLGRIGKMIGNVCDMAMLLIPGAGWSKAGKTISTVGKAGSTLRKTGEVVGKGVELIAKTDTLKDITTIAGGIKRAKDQHDGNPDKKNVFDYFSLSYWFENLGEQMDPSTKELDMEYEAKFHNLVNDAQAQLKMSLDNRQNIIANLSKLNGEKWAAQQQKAAAEEMDRKLKEDIEALKIRLDKEKTSAVRDALKSQALRQFESRINDYAESLSRRCESIVESVFSFIINAADMKITEQLESLSSQLAEISSNRDEQANEKNLKLTQLDGYLKKLNY